MSRSSDDKQLGGWMHNEMILKCKPPETEAFDDQNSHIKGIVFILEQKNVRIRWHSPYTCEDVNFSCATVSKRIKGDTEWPLTT